MKNSGNDGFAHGDDIVLEEEDVLYGNEAAAICDKIYQCCKFVVV